jgi:hypothetical protein
LLEFQCRHALEQPGAGADRERHTVQPQLVDQAGGEVLVDGGRAAGDRDGASNIQACSLLPVPSSPNGRSSVWLSPAAYPSAEKKMSQIARPIRVVMW